MRKIILVIDIGNTNIVCGLYVDKVLVNTFRISSDKARTADEHYVLINSLVETPFWTSKKENQLPPYPPSKRGVVNEVSAKRGVENDVTSKRGVVNEVSAERGVKIDYIAISSVVPAIGRAIEHTIHKYYRCPYIFVNGNTPLGLIYPVDDPSFIGADLIVNAYSAWQKYHSHCIVCDFGTATTIQLIETTGKFHGTAIMPGITTGAYKLFESAALLTHTQLESPSVLLGTNTRDALLSGIVKGHAYSIDGFVADIKAAYPHLSDIKTIATGGIASLIAEQSREIDIVDKNLTLDGLFLISQI